MKKTIYFWICCSLLFLVQSEIFAEEAQPVTPIKHYQDLKLPELNPIQVKHPERYVMENGLTVYLQEDHEVPLITAEMYIYVGARWEPVEKAGLASITGEVIRTGGSERFPGDALDEELDRNAVRLEVGIGANNGGVSLSCLKETFERGLEIMADIVRSPSFPREKIDLCKRELIGSIQRRNDEAGGICSREFNRLIYGTNTAYGHQSEILTVMAITREDIVEFHRSYFQPQNMILGIVGDFDTAQMKEMLNRCFGSWEKGSAPRPVPPALDEEISKTGGIFLVEKTDVEQSFIRMGHLGGLQSDQDYYAMSLLNYILGGGFSSRLFCNVRSDKGLAYSVGSHWQAGMDVPGIFVAAGSTRNSATVEFIETVRAEIENICRNGVTEEELNHARESALNRFVFAYDSAGKIMRRLIYYEYFGYPADRLEHYIENIRKVTREDILAAARKHLHPDNLVVLVVGNPAEFGKPLSKLGEVQKIDITIPGAPARVLREVVE